VTVPEAFSANDVKLVVNLHDSLSRAPRYDIASDAHRGPGGHVTPVLTASDSQHVGIRALLIVSVTKE
jgi:hypothetical protein